MKLEIERVDLEWWRSGPWRWRLWSRIGTWRLSCGARRRAYSSEAVSALDLAAVWGYIPADSAREALALLDRVSAMLYRLLHPR
jgi:hypothetical protein